MPPKSAVKRRNTILQKEVDHKSYVNEKLLAQKKRLLKGVKELHVQLRKEKQASRELTQATQNKSEEQLKEAREEITNLAAHVDKLLEEAAEQREETRVAITEAVRLERHHTKRSIDRQREQQLKSLQKIEEKHLKEFQKQEKEFEKVSSKLGRELDRVKEVAKAERNKWEIKLKRELDREKIR